MLNMQVVAEAAGVSKSAVSLALRNDPRLAPATRRRVQEVAARLGYRKNPVVASLMAQLRVSQTPKFQANIALINCSTERTLFDRYSFGEFRRGIREHAGRAGFGVDAFWTAGPGRHPRRLRQILQARNIRGVIVTVTVDSRPLFADHREFLDEFCLVAVGAGRSDPPLHRASNNQFQTALHAVESAFALGYRRPGLVLWDKLDRLLDRRFSAGFLAGVHDMAESAAQRVAPLLLDSPDARAVGLWLRAEKPDVVITDQTEMAAWVREMRVKVPEELGLMHLDWGPHLVEWGGVQQNSRAVGAAAADLVINQTVNNELGAPEKPKLVLIDSEFVWGPSLRPLPAAMAAAREARPAVVTTPAIVSVQ
jgi:LacI family transcriptional regulator